MSEFDPTRQLVMAKFRTVNGHNIGAGQPLTIVEEPSARGEVDEALARRLFNGRIAAYADEHRPTPVETPEQERARLAAEALRDGEGVLDDLVTWQADDAETGKKKGAKVTKDDLIVIANRENVAFESDDNKPDLIRKITAKRAGDFQTNSGAAVAPTDPTGANTAGTGPESDSPPDGDAHGAAGEGAGDTA